jgi:hypothetical protein
MSFVPNLPKDTTFQQIQFRWQEIVQVRDVAETEHQIPISICALARALNYPRSSVYLELAHRLDLPEERAKHAHWTTIVNNKFSTGFNKTPKKAHQSAKRRSKIIVRAK